MPLMTYPPFKDYLFDRFSEWEKTQPNRRSSISAYARWLSENKLNLVLKQQLVDDWIKGRYKPKDQRHLLVLEEKIGDEIYEVLEIEKPNPYLIEINQMFPNLSHEHQRKLAEDARQYFTKNHDENTSTASKRRKTRTN